MNRYSQERKSAVLKKLLPPHSLSVAELSRLEGISDATLYTWRKQAIATGESVSGSEKSASKFSAQEKLSVVIETAAMPEIELSEYCRQKGLYPIQVKEWRQACLDGQVASVQRTQNERVQSKADKKRIRDLERELNRKEKALAEAAALLVLRKKLNALWGDDDGGN